MLANFGFCRWSKHGFLELTGNRKPRRQRNTTNFAALLVVAPSRANNIPAHNRFNRQSLQSLYQHRAAACLSQILRVVEDIG